MAEQTTPEFNVFVPNFQQVKDIAKATGLDEKDLAAVILGLQTVNVVFAQIKPPQQAVSEVTNGNESTNGVSDSELAASLSAISDEFSNK
jgi:hypothetical protein